MQQMKSGECDEERSRKKSRTAAVHVLPGYAILTASEGRSLVPALKCFEAVQTTNRVL